MNSKKSIAAMVVLILLGILALLFGEKSLAIMVPAAIVIWYAAIPRLGSGRN